MDKNKRKIGRAILTILLTTVLSVAAFAAPVYAAAPAKGYFYSLLSATEKKAYDKKRHEEHKEEISKQRKEHYENNKEEISKQRKKYRETGKIDRTEPMRNKVKLYSIK